MPSAVTRFGMELFDFRDTILFHIKATVDVDDISGDIGGQVAGKEEHSIGNILRRTKAAERNGFSGDRPSDPSARRVPVP